MIICGAPKGALHTTIRMEKMNKSKIKGLENHNPIQELIRLIKQHISLKRLRVNWWKDVVIHIPTGHVIEKNLEKYPTKEVQHTTERRELFLYSLWKIETHYYYNDDDRRIVVEDAWGDEQIETHEFITHVKRRKLAWWDNYRICERFSNNMTEFDRALDQYLCGREY